MLRKSLLTIATSLACNLATADTMVVMLDISGSTPIVEPNFIRASMPILAEKIGKLSIGSNVEVMTVGDDKRMPLNLRFYVQRTKDKSGDSAANLARNVPAMVTQYLNGVRESPATKMQGESSLSPGFLDASKLCQKGKPCESVFFTDGMEFQPNVIAWPRDYSKPLPPIDGLDLNGMNVVMYGIGQCAKGLESGCATSQARIAIEGHWQTWLKKYGAGSVELRRL